MGPTGTMSYGSALSQEFRWPAEKARWTGVERWREQANQTPEKPLAGEGQSEARVLKAPHKLVAEPGLGLSSFAPGFASGCKTNRAEWSG